MTIRQQLELAQSEITSLKVEIELLRRLIYQQENIKEFKSILIPVPFNQTYIIDSTDNTL